MALGFGTSQINTSRSKIHLCSTHTPLDLFALCRRHGMSAHAFCLMHSASCCEGQGSRLFGSLPLFLYTVKESESDTSIIYVDLYTSSTLTFKVNGAQALLKTNTEWPYAADVSIIATLPEASSALEVALRMPSWLPAAVAVTVNGQAYGMGVPGTYLHIQPLGGWPQGQHVLKFSLMMRWAAANYTGASQLPPYMRASFLYGPLLMSFSGPWDTVSDSLVMPVGLHWDRPEEWLVGAADGNSLHFAVKGTSGASLISVKPYYEVQAFGERFSNYPCFR